ncbi:MAG: response regulator [Deltaproteobacteria bacterium]|nr:response regulator [Deltaproteobacteria bacterium]
MQARRQVLLVEDQADQRETLRRGLFLLGLDCVTAGCAAEALAHLQGPAGDRVELLLTDLTLPGTSGAQLIERARATRPGLPVLVITGLALSSEVTALRARGIPILRKPFTPDQLGNAIAAAVAADRGTNEGDLP